ALKLLRFIVPPEATSLGRDAKLIKSPSRRQGEDPTPCPVAGVSVQAIEDSASSLLCLLFFLFRRCRRQPTVSCTCVEIRVQLEVGVVRHVERFEAELKP